MIGVIAAALAGVGAGAASAQAAALGSTSDFLTPSSASDPSGIAAGPNGFLWFTEPGRDRIGELNPYNGQIVEFGLPTPNAYPTAITVGPDGNLWFTEYDAGRIGEINPFTGAVSEFPTPTPNSEPAGIVAGPNGNLWFTEQLASKIGEISPSSHAVAEFSTPTAAAAPTGITAGASGTLWFTETNARRIGMLTAARPAAITEIPLPFGARDPTGIANGPSGTIWFTESATPPSAIGEINPAVSATTINEIPLARSTAAPAAITAGPDGDVWFTESDDQALGRINPSSRALLDTFATPSADPTGIAVGEDGNVWFTEGNASRVGEMGTGAASAPVTPPAVSGVATPGATLSCHGAAWASWGGLQPTVTMAFEGDQWLFNGTAIPGATAATYVPTGPEVGGHLACRTTVGYPLQNSFASSTSAQVTVGLPPAASAPPTITGKAIPGETLTEGHAAWVNGVVGYAYQWQLCTNAGASCAPVPGATGQTFTIPAADGGLSVRVAESAVNGYGSGVAVISAATAILGAPLPSLGAVSTSGASATVRIACTGQPGKRCTGTYRVRSAEQLRGRSVVGVAAAVRTSTKTVDVAGGAYTVRAGTSVALHVKLNRTGRALLDRFYRLPAGLVLHETYPKGTVVPADVLPAPAATLGYRWGRIRIQLNDSWQFGASSTLNLQLSVTGVPARGKVKLVCAGGGCPFSSRSVKPHRGAAGLGGLLRGASLAPGATVDLEVLAPNRVGNVVRFTVRPSREPRRTSLCLAPGTRRPTRCA